MANQIKSINADGSYTISFTGVTGLAYTDYAVVYGKTGKPVSASYSNGQTQTWTYDDSGVLVKLSTAGVIGQSYTSTDVFYGANGKAMSQTWSNGGTVFQAKTFNADGSTHDVHYYGITGQAYTDYDVVYGANGKAASATYSNGTTQSWFYNADGSLHETVMSGLTNQNHTSVETLYGSNGKAVSEVWLNGSAVVQTKTFNADGSTHDIHYYGITGQEYTDYDVVYRADGKPVSATYSNGMNVTRVYADDGSLRELVVNGITGQSYTSTDTVYASNGKIISQTFGGSPVKSGGSAVSSPATSSGTDAAHADTTPPVVTVSSAGNLTNHSAQTISGTGEAGTTVSIFEGTTKLATVVVGSSGNWTSNVSLSGDGAHVLTAQDVDAAGNIGTSKSVTYTLDTAAPTVSISGAGGLAAQSKVALKGTVGIADAGTTVSIFEDTTQLGTATVGADGSWSLNVTLSGDGVHVLTAHDVDLAGNAGTSGPVTYVLDTTAPTVAITSAGGAVTQASQVLKGVVDIADAGTTVKVFEGTTQVGTAVVDSNGNWSAGVALNGYGAHTFTAQDTDHAGNVGTSAAVSFNLGLPAATSDSSASMMGVNLPQASFYQGAGNPAIWPTADELAYYASKGMGVVRVAFTWEQMQPTLGGGIDPTQLAKLEAFLDQAKANGIQVILDLHSFGSYNGNPIGSSAVSIAAFQDFWTKLAGDLKGYTNIYGYDIMNEPHGLPNASVWPAAAQAAINGIRSVDMTHAVIVEGDNWSSAASWQTINNNLLMKDPANNVIYEAHLYLDADGSGTYKGTYDQEGAYAMVGVDRLQPFADWLQQNNVKGIIGEFGVPNNDPRWLTAMDNLLAAMKQDGIAGTAWSGGKWSAGYTLSVEPSNGQDAAQMAVLAKYSAIGTSMTLNTSQVVAVETGAAAIVQKQGLTVNVADTAAHIMALTADQIVGMSALGILTVNSTEIATLTLAQQQAFGKASIALSETDANGVTQVLSWNSDGSIHDIYHHNITGQTYTDYYVLYANGSPTTAHYSNGATEKWTNYATSLGYSFTSTDQLFDINGKLIQQSWLKGSTLIKSESWNSDGSVHDIHTYNVTAQQYTDYDVLYANGKQASATYSNGMTQSWTYNADGTLHDIAYKGITGGTSVSSVTGYASGGAVVVQENTSATGAETIHGYGDGSTLHVSGTAVSMSTSAGLAFNFGATTNTTLTGGGNNETFVFNAGFGQSRIIDFVPNSQSNTNHDVIEFAKGAFTDFNDLLSHSKQSGASVIITDHVGDVLTLQGVALANLTRADFLIHS